ncbi:MAG: phosphoglycolate phosphatase [Patescibacteria group bacterium]|jgi:phosphoglycolate phosphatase-like HAD superfamily hydrolase|nr:phosphoglycolate phosphatase [Patescibacteria group bacterium]
MFKHLSFDFDGVLARGSNEAYVDCFLQAFNDVGAKLSNEIARKKIIEYWGLPVPEFTQKILGDEPEKIPEAIRLFDLARRSPAFLAQVSLFDGAAETLRQLKTDYSLSIVSGADRALILSVLGPELASLFTSIHAAPEYPIDQQKPAPYMLEEALRLAGAQPNEAAYIGDAPNDLRMALAAQVTPVAILTGHLTRQSAATLGAAVIINDIRDFPEAILNRYE